MMNEVDEVNGQQTSGSKVAAMLVKLCVLTAFATAVFFVFRNDSDTLTLSNLATQEAELREFQQRHPILVYGLAVLIYVAVAGLSLPGAAVLTLVYGWYFGIVPGVVVVSFGSTAGATLAFLLSRYLFGKSMQNRFGDKLESFNAALEQEGAYYLFTLRLIPAVPFFVINAVMGLTKLRTSTFWWVSQLGMFPGTIVYVYAGSSVPDLKTLADQGINAVFTTSQLAQIVSAFVLLGLFPIVIKKLMQRFRRAAISSEQAPSK